MLISSLFDDYVGAAYKQEASVSHVITWDTQIFFMLLLHGPNPTKTRFILKYKLRTLQYLRAHGILQNSNPSILRSKIRHKQQ